MSHLDITVLPDLILIQTEDEWAKMDKSSANAWSYKDAEVFIENQPDKSEIFLTSQNTPVKRIAVKWKQNVNPGSRILGDHWERGYGDLEWRGIVPERVMPWYFLVNDEIGTSGYGVKTGPNAMCFWQLSHNEVILCMDVRNGGAGVLLSGRRLRAASLVSRHGQEGESPFAAATAFCKKMCETPVMPTFPVYGGNNWYYAYGRSSHNEILDDSRRISDWASSSDNRPFMVIDAGWQEILLDGESSSGGPWKSGNCLFPDMASLAQQMKEAGVRPGLWCRPLMTVEKLPREWLLPKRVRVLDPSIPDVLAHIGRDMERFVSWGYQLIKHDFSSYDIFGRWGFAMGGQLNSDGWFFRDRSKTTAEIIKDLYATIYKAGKGALILGCNTVGHLGAGMFHIQRTGDDTSGLEWERTRKMGINTLAFRMPQHGNFFAVDGDCVGLTTKVPWSLNRQWLDLLSRSGTPLFISAAPDALGKEQQSAIRQAFDLAAKSMPAGEPLDWMETTCPSRWMLHGSVTEFTWADPEGTPVL